MATSAGRLPQVGTIVCRLPACQGFETHADADWDIRDANTEVRSCPHGHRRPTASLQGLQVLFHDDRQDNKVVRGNTGTGYYCRDGRTFFIHWVARYGTPARVTTDQGRQFEADLFQKLTQLTSTQHWRATTYHPAANGIEERFHQQMKAAIMCHQTEDWMNILPVILLGIRSVFKEDIKTTPTELIYGESVRLPDEFWQSAEKRE